MVWGQLVDFESNYIVFKSRTQKFKKQLKITLNEYEIKKGK